MTPITFRTICRLAASIGVAAGLSIAAAAQSPAPQSEKALPVFADGQAQIVPGFQDPAQWIQQTLWVETEFDSDGDGKKRSHVRRRDASEADRHRRAEGAGDLRVVAVLTPARPAPREFLWNVKQEVGAAPPPRTSQPAIRVQADARRTCPTVAGEHVGAARLRRRALRCAGHRAVAGLRRRSATRRKSSRRKPSSTG